MTVSEGAASGQRLAVESGAVLVQFIIAEPEQDDSYAILFLPDGGVAPVDIPEFNAAILHELTREWDDAYNVYQMAALNDPRYAAALRPTDRARMLGVLGELYERLMGRIQAALWANDVSPDSRLVLFPGKELARLPIHACYRKEDHRDRYLLDDFVISYAPSLSAFANSLLMNAQAKRERGMGVGNPGLDLEFAQWEFDVIYRTLGKDKCILLLGKEASRSRVLEMMARHHWLHFACHSEFNSSRPGESRLRLAGKDSLYARDIVEWNQLPGAYLVVLSSCESGLYGFHDLLGLPTAFLQIGAPTVYATLWAVRDSLSLFLMHRTYQELNGAGPGVAKPQALRRAQRWLRDLTVAGALKWLSELQRLAGPEAGRALGHFDDFLGKLEDLYGPEYRHFDHPRLWAAFQCLGV